MTAQAAIIRFQGHTTALEEGSRILVGRGSECDLHVGRAPSDSRVSRVHLELSLSDGLVSVTRRSRTQLVVVQHSTGQYALEAAGDAVIRGGVFEILIPRTPDNLDEQAAYYRLSVSAPGPGDAAPPGSFFAGSGVVTAMTGPRPALNERERRLLAAYAQPLLRQPNPAATAATHRQVAASLHYGYDWVREQIDTLRQRLADEGWPVGPDKESLCRWAITAGLLTEHQSLSSQH